VTSITSNAHGDQEGKSRGGKVYHINVGKKYIKGVSSAFLQQEDRGPKEAEREPRQSGEPSESKFKKW